jgi:hypothetical protein
MEFVFCLSVDTAVHITEKCLDTLILTLTLSLVIFTLRAVATSECPCKVQYCCTESAVDFEGVTTVRSYEHYLPEHGAV